MTALPSSIFLHTYSGDLRAMPVPRFSAEEAISSVISVAYG
jgi:hypothetical protein